VSTVTLCPLLQGPHAHHPHGEGEPCRNSHREFQEQLVIKLPSEQPTVETASSTPRLFVRKRFPRSQKLTRQQHGGLLLCVPRGSRKEYPFQTPHKNGWKCSGKRSFVRFEHLDVCYPSVRRNHSPRSILFLSLLVSVRETDLFFTLEGSFVVPVLPSQPCWAYGLLIPTKHRDVPPIRCPPTYQHTPHTSLVLPLPSRARFP